MHAKATVTAIVILISLLSGCTSTKTPVQTIYNDPGPVSAVIGSQLIGLWNVSDLNASGANENSSQTVEYKTDGTVTSFVTLGRLKPEDVEDLVFEFNGNWSLNEGVVTHTNVKIESRADSEIGDFLSNAVNNRNATAVKLKINEFSENRIVMVDSKGVAKVYLRQTQN